MLEIEFDQKVDLSLEIESIKVRDSTFPLQITMGKLSQNPRETVVLGVVLNFDGLYLPAQMDFLTKLKFYH